MRAASWFVIVTYRNETKVDHLLVTLGREQVKVTKNTLKKNLGFGGGANEGMTHAFKHGAEWIIILNQDVSLTKQGVEEFVKLLKKTPAGIMGPEAGSLDKKRWTSILPGKESVDYISGSCMAIHRNVIKKIGGFYEPYFMYYEDVDVCVRARKAGFPIKKMGMLGFVHKERPILKKGSFFQEYYLARNHLLFVQRNATLAVQIREIARMPLVLAKYCRNGNIGALNGIKDFALRRFGPYRRSP